jgi:RecG-like helicase
MAEIMKRAIAYKVRIGDILKEEPVFDGERFIYVPYDDKQLIRVNVVANIVDKYEGESEKKYLNFTIDDASSQIKLKIFGEEVDRFKDLTQGDTVVIIGTLRFYNNEIYINPEIIKKKEPPYLLVRKLELEKLRTPDKKEIIDLRDKIIEMIKKEDDNGGIEVNNIVMELKNDPEVINKEVAKLLEEGMIYEPRPGKIRILG